MATCDANETGLRIGRLRDGLQEALRARREADESYRSGDYQEDRGFRERCKALEQARDGALASEEEVFTARRAKVLERFARRDAAAARALSSCEGRLRGELQRELKVLGDVLKRAKEQMDAAPGGEAPAASRYLKGLQTEVEPLRALAAELCEELERFADGHGARLGAAAKQSEIRVLGAASGPDPNVGHLAEGLRETKRAVRELSRAFWPDLAKGISVAVLLVLALLAHALGGAAILHFSLGNEYFAAAGASLLLSAAAIFIAAFVARRKAAAAAGRLHAQARSALQSLAEIEDRNEMEERIARIMVVDEQVSAQMEEKRGVCERRTAELRRRHGELAGRLTAERDRRLLRLEQSHAAEVRRIGEGHSRELAGVQSGHQETSRRLKLGHEAAIAELAARWQGLLDDFLGFVRQASSGCRERHPSWNGPAWKSPRLATAFPEEVPLGTARLDLALLVGEPEGGTAFPLPPEPQVNLPVALGFPSCGSLLVEAAGPGRGRALETLFNATLRLLVAFPPGKAQLTIVDPVGLGQSFAALMHLADHDESLAGARIWTETAHIERKLGDLTEHIEKVIQKYLRNRYATVADYNREAGEMTEAYQFLVVSDFPAGFSDLALERLASIVNSGPQCGVYTLILRDTAQPLPAALDAARLRRNGPVLAAAAAAGEDFTVDREDFLHAPFAAEAPPDGETVSRLLKAVGEGAREGRRVELPFTAVIPPEGRLWSASAEDGIRVPIGRTGADRLQYLDLGRGTAQHALIGGRTGSGKSTLFHVIATNAAMWFGPGEIELHMVDFKHGVEFKTYATAGLPHARVIAIESDREFGLSVLNHINRELNRRGDIFRKCGVQDLAGFRKSGAAERMARVLLVIDEFQEFFSEDDAIARDAALLLDRFVRQGRAFGVHVVLGSQTLSGMYTLAKSTLGQIGVRVALQCNEADSHLILGEDNSAARLLTRPGEAIYNDMSGLVEGNSPFQVVWLPDEVRDGCLRQVAEKAAREGWRAPSPPVVFEGNIPAELSRNAELRELLATPAAPAVPAKKGREAAAAPAAGRIWLGEPNAIKGPAEVRLVPASGSNLLIVGQHREGALALLCSAAVSLAAGSRPGDLRLIALGADGRDAESSGTLARLAGALPHGIELPASRDIPKVVEELEKLIAANREAGEPPARRVCLMVYGLQRFQALRHEDDFGLSGSEEGASAGERFAGVLRDGPEHGVHTLVWCDTLGNLNRTISRKTLREFDLRVLFQVSVSDSSELIDSAAAGNLGLHNALLVCQSEGTTEKFRPYTSPDPAYLEEVGRAIAGRFSLKA